MNQGFRHMFAPGHLTLGIFFPIEAYTGSIPSMTEQVERAQRADPWGSRPYGVEMFLSMITASGMWAVVSSEHPLSSADPRSINDQLTGLTH